MDEPQAIENVRRRLVERFPDLPGDAVRLTVQDIYSRFDGRVRDYVPVLVEREARDRLDALAAPFRRGAGRAVGSPSLGSIAR